MSTTVLSPPFGDNTVEICRRIVHNNGRISRICFVLHTNEKWLPLILSQAGFFPSNGEVKRNRSDLWRDATQGEVIELKWAEIFIVKHSSVERRAS